MYRYANTCSLEICSRLICQLSYLEYQKLQFSNQYTRKSTLISLKLIIIHNSKLKFSTLNTFYNTKW